MMAKTMTVRLRNICAPTSLYAGIVSYGGGAVCWPYRRWRYGLLDGHDCRFPLPRIGATCARFPSVPARQGIAAFSASHDTPAPLYSPRPSAIMAGAVLLAKNIGGYIPDKLHLLHLHCGCQDYQAVIETGRGSEPPLLGRSRFGRPSAASAKSRRPGAFHRREHRSNRQPH